jgi:hypothetical protein
LAVTGPNNIAIRTIRSVRSLARIARWDDEKKPTKAKAIRSIARLAVSGLKLPVLPLFEFFPSKAVTVDERDERDDFQVESELGQFNSVGRRR